VRQIRVSLAASVAILLAWDRAPLAFIFIPGVEDKDFHCARNSSAPHDGAAQGRPADLAMYATVQTLTGLGR